MKEIQLIQKHITTKHLKTSKYENGRKQTRS